MESDDSTYKTFSDLYKLHQPLMMMMSSQILLIGFISKPNTPLIRTLTCTHTHPHSQRLATAVGPPALATQQTLRVTHSREERQN